MGTTDDPLAAHALELRERVREFALGLPGAREEFPWGESVAKVSGKVFVFLGLGDGSHPPGMTVKLKDENVHGHALAVPGAEPAGYGLGRSGWVSVPFGEGAPEDEVLCEWVEESYRTVAPKGMVGKLDGSARP